MKNREFMLVGGECVSPLLILSGSSLNSFQILIADAGVNKATDRFLCLDNSIQSIHKTANIAGLVVVLTTTVEFDGDGITFGSDGVNSGRSEVGDHVNKKRFDVDVVLSGMHHPR